MNIINKAKPPAQVLIGSFPSLDISTIEKLPAYKIQRKVIRVKSGAMIGSLNRVEIFTYEIDCSGNIKRFDENGECKDIPPKDPEWYWVAHAIRYRHERKFLSEKERVTKRPEDLVSLGQTGEQQ